MIIQIICFPLHPENHEPNLLLNSKQLKLDKQNEAKEQ